MRLLGLLMRFLGMFESLPGELLPGEVILLLMGYSGTSVSVRGKVVQLRGSLMILVVRSVVITSRHFKDSLSAQTWPGLLL